jgi:hypothetical protein
MAFAFSAIFPAVATVAIALVLTAGGGTAYAGDDFPLIGSYTQNAPCKGDGSDPVAIQLKILPKEIVSNVGVCTILDTKHEGGSYKAHVECQFAGGPLMGDISFTPLPDKTIDFVDRDGNYKAVLHRCPD